jgi:acetyl esterase/lipase
MRAPGFNHTRLEMKPLLVTAILYLSLAHVSAQMQPAIPLWAGGAPGALGTSSNDIPTLTPYLPDPASATGAAMVICPGGSYEHLSPREGNDYALWLNQHGVTGFVLKYRLASSGYHHPAMLQDAARAVRLVRAQADAWKIDPSRVGIIGSSAGGHLAATLLTHFDSGNAAASDPIERQSSRPDAGVLCYAVISLGQYTHAQSKRNVLGPNPSPELADFLSNELQVTPNTPPCFIWATYEDKTVPMENSMLFASALRKNNVPFALDIYQKGGHGLGLADSPPFSHPHPWAADCLVWLQAQGFVK